MRSFTLICAAALSMPLTFASPMGLEKKSAGPDSGLEFDKGEFAKHEKGQVNPLLNQVPSCKGADNDPTWTRGKSMYADGAGVFITKDCAKKGKDNNCWTDYMIVGSKFHYTPWMQAMGNINCPDNGTCAQAVGKWGQSCTSSQWSITGSAGVEFDLIAIKGKVEVSGTYGQTKQTCSTDTTQSTCTWNNEGCHSIWKSDMVQTVYGYMRRSCTKPSHNKLANMMDSPQRPDGFYTRGMTDFQFDLPGVTAVDCLGTCDPGYKGPTNLPYAQNNGDMVPWPLAG